MELRFKTSMKKESYHSFQVRLTAEMHLMLKETAAAQGVSMHQHIMQLLEESLTKFPSVINLPVVLKQYDTGFAARIPVELHTKLVFASRSSERSMNLEILGRLILMTSPSQQSVLEAWSVLDQAISSLLERATDPESGTELARARQCFEWKLQHSLATSVAGR
jgi:predicted HicB family RNase H-like nuclease